MDYLLLGTLGASFGRQSSDQNRRKSNQSWKGSLMTPYSLTNFEIKNYYQNEPKSKGVYSRNNLPKLLLKAMKEGDCVINLAETQ